MRPVLKPALRQLWRGPSTLQLGLDPRRAVVLHGVGATETRLLSALDGTRDRGGVVEAAATLGVPPREAERFLDLLHRAGALDDGAAPSRATAALPQAERERLAPDLAAWSLAGAAADDVLRQRQASVVAVRGAGRLGAQIAVLLAAAGVGHVTVDDDQPVRRCDAAPGGLLPSDHGLARARAAERAIRRAAPATRTAPRGRVADLTVLAAATTAAERQALLREHAPHLHVGVRETTGVVGPLVIPGRGPCQRCIELSRAERDPVWPQLAAQLAGRRNSPSEPCDVVLAAIVAGSAALQALAYLDAPVTSGAEPAAIGGTLELAPPDWRLRRRSWAAHPACGCQWSTSPAE